VVLQLHVVVRLVLLDQVGLEDQRLDLVLGDDELEGSRVGRDVARLLGRGAPEVAAHPAAQVDGLADVDDGAVGPDEGVAAGRGRENREVASLHRSILSRPLRNGRSPSGAVAAGSAARGGSGPEPVREPQTLVEGRSPNLQRAPEAPWKRSGLPRPAGAPRQRSSINASGFSSRSMTKLVNIAPSAPSTSRWSNDRLR